MSEEPIPPTPELPAFPVITVHIETETGRSSASAQGTGLYIDQFDTERFAQEDERDYRNEIVATAASKVLDDLNQLTPVRVRVQMDEDTIFNMWMEPGGHRVHPVENPDENLEGPQQSRGILGLAPKLFFSLLSVLLIGVIMTVLVLNKGSKEEAAPIYTPPPVQLPVSAPAGWDTYADYSLEATTAAPLILGEDLLYAQGSELRIANASDGVRKSTHSAGFDITAIYPVHGLGENVIAVSGGNNQAAIGTQGSDLHTIEKPTDQAELHWVSGVPVYTSTGAVWVPDTQGQLTKLTAPADSLPAVVSGTAVWMVSTVDAQGWLISTDDAELPAPVSIPAPGGYTYKGLIAGVNSQIVVAFSNDKSTENQIVIVDSTADGALENGRSVAGNYNQHNIAVDIKRNLLLTGSTLIDVVANQAMNTGGNATYGGGYAWARGTEAKRIAVTGEVTTWATSSSQPTIPADIDSAGRAVVLYKPNAQDVPSKLYVLRKE